jgi:hypothetical protein
MPLLPVIDLTRSEIEVVLERALQIQAREILQDPQGQTRMFFRRQALLEDYLRDYHAESGPRWTDEPPPRAGYYWTKPRYSGAAVASISYLIPGQWAHWLHDQYSRWSEEIERPFKAV